MRLSRWLLVFFLLLPAAGFAASVLLSPIRASDDNPEPVAELAKALADDHALIRKRAALALGRLGP
jgi:HEAT repeat protein